MIIVVERKDEIHLKLNKEMEQEGIKGVFESGTERENKMNLQTELSANSFEQRICYLFIYFAAKITYSLEATMKRKNDFSIFCLLVRRRTQCASVRA